ncbi:MAG: hypothetical protein MUO23_14210 [Anaerolineales bacterium]|nr:hypothetical protein [Anaerolineales bacterium]
MAEVRRLSPEDRNQLAGLLDPRSVADALPAYYALTHPADRVSLYAYYHTPLVPSGFIVLARTGFDLFRPLAVPFVATASGLSSLLAAAIEPARPVILTLPVEQREWVHTVADLGSAVVLDLLRVDARSYSPVLNVLVVEATAPGGMPRYEIRSGGVTHAAAGLNWIGELYAEVYLEVSPEAAGRPYGKSVLSAITGRLLAEGKVALLRLEEPNLAGHVDAYEIGFRRTGERSLVGQAVLRDDSPIARADLGASNLGLS